MQKILTGITEKDLEGTAMSKDKYSYIALFTYEEDGISIKFPDLPGCYPCADKDNTDEALKNAKEALGLHLWGMEQDHEIIPEPSSITDLKFAANQTPVQIDVFMPPVRERMNGQKTI
jgi:predicted RNase H-like HicB family nuclease